MQTQTGERRGSEDSPWTWAAVQQQCHTGSHIPCTTVKEKKKVNTNILRKKYALNKNSPLLEGPHHWRQGRSQLVTLVLNILNERVYKWGVGLCFCLSISQKLDAVLANSIIFLQKRPHLGSRGKIWLLMWVHVNLKKKKSTCFRGSCLGDSWLGLSWGYRSWGTLTMKGDTRWERSTLGISLDTSCSVASALAKAACSDWHSPMADRKSVV